MSKHTVKLVKSSRSIFAAKRLNWLWLWVEYWLASLKVITIVIFIIIGILVNVGVNTSHSYIGGHYFHLPGAPGGFVGGFGGFAQVFVTASFACEFSIPSALERES